MRCGWGMTTTCNILAILPMWEFSDLWEFLLACWPKKLGYHKQGGMSDTKSPSLIWGSRHASVQRAIQSVIMSSTHAQSCALELLPMLLIPTIKMMTCEMWLCIWNISKSLCCMSCSVSSLSK